MPRVRGGITWVKRRYFYLDGKVIALDVGRHYVHRAYVHDAVGEDRHILSRKSNKPCGDKMIDKKAQVL